MNEEGFKSQFTQYSDFVRRHATEILDVVTSGMVILGRWGRWGAEVGYRYFASMVTWLFNENIWQQVHSFLHRGYRAATDLAILVWGGFIALTGDLLKSLGTLLKECMVRAFSSITIAVAVLYGLSRAAVDYAVGVMEYVCDVDWNHSSVVEYMKQGLSGLLVVAALYPILWLPYWVIGVGLCLTQVGEFFSSFSAVKANATTTSVRVQNSKTQDDERDKPASVKKVLTPRFDASTQDKQDHENRFDSVSKPSMPLIPSDKLPSLVNK